jgi:hypothetical protein
VQIDWLSPVGLSGPNALKPAGVGIGRHLLAWTRWHPILFVGGGNGAREDVGQVLIPLRRGAPVHCDSLQGSNAVSEWEVYGFAYALSEWPVR